MILDENPNFPQKFVKNLHIQNCNKKKKIDLLNSTWLVLRLCQFSS